MPAKPRHKSAPATSLDGRLKWLALLTLPLLVAILYGSALEAPFVYDDRVHIVESPLVTAFHSVTDAVAIRAVFNQPSGLAGRPLLLITYGFNFVTSGLNPGSFREINLVIHVANSFLVFLIVRELAALAGLPHPRRFWLPFLASIVFVCHPLATESVTYITGRSSSLCATFYFLGLLSTLYAGRLESPRRWLLLIFTVACAAIGWLVKQEAVTLPAASCALIWLAWPQKVPSKVRWLASLVPATAILILLALQTKPITELSAATRTNETLVAAGFDTSLPFNKYFLTSIKEYAGYYLWRFALPQHLNVDPDPTIVNTPINFGFILSAAVLSGLAVAVFWLRRLRPVAAIGILLILVSPLSAYCLFPLADVVAEHRAYISLLGAAIVVADVLQARRLAALSLGLVVMYASLTIDRNKVWNDEVRLWENAEQQSPDKIRPHLNLGSLYQARGRTAEAQREYEWVLQRVPEHTASLSNLGSLYLAANDVTKAEKVLGTAVSQNTNFPAVYVNLAVVRMRQSRLNEARDLLQRAAALGPQELLIHHNLGDILLNQGKPADAIAEYQAELMRNPDFALTHLHLALAYEAAGMPEIARNEYRTVLRLEPGNQEAQTALEKLK